MNLERAFLHALAENPEDDSPRLIFADWLDDNGHPARAQYIRNECEWARTGNGPVRVKEGNYAAKWISDGKAAWLAVLPSLQSNPWRFTRGIPEGVGYAYGPVEKLLGDAPLLFSVPTIREIYLDCVFDEGESEIYSYESRGGIDPSQIEALANLPGLAQIRVLHLRNADLPVEQWQTLLHSPHLTNLSLLDLAGCNLSADVIRVLVGSPLSVFLQTLCLMADVLTRSDQWSQGSSCPLSIDSNGVGILAAAPSLTGLRVLDLSGTRLARAAVEALIHSPYLSRDLRLVLKTLASDALA